MSALNLHALPVEELMPLPDLPESYGPRNEEDLAVFALVKVGIAGPSTKYETVADFMRALDARMPA